MLRSRGPGAKPPRPSLVRAHFPAFTSAVSHGFSVSRFLKAIEPARVCTHKERWGGAALKEAEGFGPQDPRLATSLNNLAVVYDDLARYAEAEPLYKRALAIREKALGPDQPRLAKGLYNIALL